MTERHEDVTFEKVLAVYDYWDGPRIGIAYAKGGLCYFKSGWDEAADDYAEEFGLWPMAQELAALDAEQANAQFRNLIEGSPPTMHAIGDFRRVGNFHGWNGPWEVHWILVPQNR